MRKISIGIGLATFVTLMMLMSVGTAMADTSVRVDWNSPNPDINVETLGSGSSTYPYSSSSAWASVSGSGDSASGTIEVSNTFSGAGEKTAWQTADFEGGDYTASVSTRYEDGSWHNTYSEHQVFEVKNTDTASVGQEVSSKAVGSTGAEYITLDSYQQYEATDAGSVTAGGFISDGCDIAGNTPASVTYTGNAHGDVSGSQGSYQPNWNFPIGFGAGISGTEGTTYFHFDTSNISNINTGSSDGYSVSGEAKQWAEDSGYDDAYDLSEYYSGEQNFNWIE